MAEAQKKEENQEAEAVEAGESVEAGDSGDSGEAIESGEAVEAGEAIESGETSRLHGRYVFNPAKPLKIYDSPSAKAYAVTDDTGKEKTLFGLICTPGLPFRVDIMAAMKREQIKGLMVLRDWGVVNWPPLEQKCMAVVYEAPAGIRLGRAPDTVDIKINEYDIARRVVEPILSGLQEMVTLNVFHRAIRPHNMFFEDAGNTEVVLGDAATAPPGFDQPVVFESIERAMACPAGRGMGAPIDDMYALGVSLVFLVLGENPVIQMSDDDLIASKIEIGSYATLCGGVPIPVPMIEPLRGLLSDDPAERWHLDQLDIWASGRQSSPVQRKSAKKADIGFEFDGKEHFTTRTLARAFPGNVKKAAKVIFSGELAMWIRRSLKHVELSEALIGNTETAKVNDVATSSQNDIFISQISMLLDPSGPIHYKGLSVLPEGFGPALAVEMLHHANPQRPAEILSKDLTIAWLKSQEEYSPEFSSLEKTFSLLKGFLKLSEMGYGIERCLYELNPMLPCQSPFIVKEHVMELNQVLITLDEAAATADTSTLPMDRHLAAFMGTHFDQDISPHLRALGSKDEAERILGVLSLLALLQWRLRVGPLKNLTKWIAGHLGPAVATYHSRTVRKEIERKIPIFARDGKLTDLFELIDNQKKRQVDRDDFKVSIAQFVSAELEFRKIEKSNSEDSSSVERVGQRVASLISLFLGLIISSMLLVMDIW